MVNLEYVIKSDCKPTAISLFFKGQHSSIIPDPCPCAFSYNWHQILFWRRDLFPLAFSQQLASVCDLANEAHGSSSPNVSHGRSPGPFPSQPPPLGVRRWLCCSFITRLSTGGWSWACLDLGGLNSVFQVNLPIFVTCPLCSHNMHSGICWSSCRCHYLCCVHRVPRG